MNDLNSIIATLSAENRKEFLTFIDKKNKRKDTKNILLFKLLLKNELTSEQICKTLYTNNNKVAYHALRKRLYQSIIDFIANINMIHENSVDIQLIKYLIVARHFFKYQKPKIAYKILSKAELLAKSHQSYTILSEIYYTKIQFSHLNNHLDLEKLITKNETNRMNLKLENQLNLLYAKIRKSLKDMNHTNEIVEFKDIIQKIFKNNNINIAETLTYHALYQIMTIISISAFVSKNYLKTEKFILSTYKTLENNKTSEKQLYYQIQVLFLIANTLFMNKKFQDSLTYLSKMKKLMQLNNKKYQAPFLLKYNLLLGLNLNYSNNQEAAIEVLEPFLKPNFKDKQSLLYIYLSLIMFYIQKSEFKKALHLFSEFYHTDNWYINKVGKEWTIKKNLIEIILHIELNNIDYVESRLLSFKRNHNEYLKQIDQHRVITYVGLIEAYYKYPEKIVSNQFQEKVESSFEWIDRKYEDIFVMSFYAWLKSKMEKRDLYATTLDLVTFVEEH